MSNNRGRSLGTRKAVAIANAKRKVRRLRQQANLLCGELPGSLTLDDAERSLNEGKCPVCGQPFDKCDYFKGLEE